MPLNHAARKAALAAGLFGLIAATGPLQAETVVPASNFAVVDGEAIDAVEFEQFVFSVGRQKFYHGRIPDGQLGPLYREAAQQLIDRRLLAAAARKRGIVADEAEVDRQVAEYEKRYAGNAGWEKNREVLVAGLKARLREQSVLGRLEAEVRKLPLSTADEVRAYYAAHPDYFTEPEGLRVSVILIKVHPSSLGSEWTKAYDEVVAMRAQLVEGADFGELARKHSNDVTAPKGGDMGYLHRGMLPEPLHEQLDALKVGALSEPLRLLEGIALFRLDERRPARKRSFEDVADNAADLATRDRAEAAWKGFVADLRAGADIRINAERYPLLKTEDAKIEDATAPAAAPKGAAGH